MATPEPVFDEPSTGGEIVPFRPRNSLSAKIEYAKALAKSQLLPAQYRDKPENMLWATEYAEMLGLPPMAAVTGIHVIEGKPSASAALISALVRRAGHRLRINGNDQKAVAEIVRSDDPDFTFRSEWTIERAKQANLTGKSVWKQYPAAMLKARAITEVARDACEEALAGMHYTAEELGAEVNEDGVPTVIVEQVKVVRPEVDWDEEIAKCGEDGAALNALFKRAPQHVKTKLKEMAAARKAAATPAPAVEEPEVVEGEIVEEPKTVTELMDLLLGATSADQAHGLRDAINTDSKAARSDVSGIIPADVAQELGIDRKSRLKLSEFATLVAVYVTDNGYSVDNGVAQAVAEESDRANPTLLDAS